MIQQRGSDTDTGGLTAPTGPFPLAILGTLGPQLPTLHALPTVLSICSVSEEEVDVELVLVSLPVHMAASSLLDEALNPPSLSPLNHQQYQDLLQWVAVDLGIQQLLDIFQP